MTLGTTMEYNPFSPDFYTSDPFEVYRSMRDEAPGLVVLMDENAGAA